MAITSEKGKMALGAGVGLTALVASDALKGIDTFTHNLVDKVKFVGDKAGASSVPVSNPLSVLSGAASFMFGYVARPLAALKTYAAYEACKAIQLIGFTGDMDYGLNDFFTDSSATAVLMGLSYGLGYSARRGTDALGWTSRTSTRAPSRRPATTAPPASP